MGTVDELAQIVRILDLLPEFEFSDHEKRDILEEEVVKSFDGSFEYLVDFHARLKEEWFLFQNARAEYFTLFGKILRTFSAATAESAVDFGLGDFIESDSGKVTLAQYLLSTNQAISNQRFGFLITHLSILTRSALGTEAPSSTPNCVWIRLSCLQLLHNYPGDSQHLF
jgi:hypothetical protein